MEVMVTKYGRLTASYTTHTAKRVVGGIRLKNYKQQDVHSCGFLAALTVVRYYKIDVSDREVLAAVRPSVNYGVETEQLMAALDNLGVNTVYRTNLTVAALRRYVERGVPVIISVWPDEWLSDHYVVVQGFAGERVYLTNHPSLPLREFRRQWTWTESGAVCGAGHGIVCTE